MMNRRTWIAGITATTLLAASLTACKQEQQGEETGQALPVMVVSSQPIEFEENYSASIRGRQDVDIIPQVSGRIIRLYNPQIQISAESETKRSIFREKDKTKRSKKESAQHSKSRNKSFVMTSVSAL